MRICVDVEGQEGISWHQYLALAHACEAAGIEALFTSDHYASTVGRLERPSLDTWATLNALSAVTSRLRLGSMVSPATFRHPSELAKVVATADHVSGGRVELGFGAGWYELEHLMYGFPFPGHRTRLEMFSEQLEIINRAWAGSAFDFNGLHYELTDCLALPKPVQSPRPPIIVGGFARPGTTKPAALYADEYNFPFASVATCREHRDRVRDACEQVGRDPNTMVISLMTGFVVAEDEKSLLRRLGRVMEWENVSGRPKDFLDEKRGEWIVGTVPEVIARLDELAAVGVDRVFLQLLDYEDLETIALVGEAIVPAAAAAGPGSD